MAVMAEVHCSIGCNDATSKTDIILDYYELCWQKLSDFIKAKILTAQYQAVRILYGAPERTRTFTSQDTRS